jgi:hypothetical protein
VNKKHTHKAAKQNAAIITTDKVETPVLTMHPPEAIASASVASIVEAGGTFPEGTLANDVAGFIIDEYNGASSRMKSSLFALDSANRTSQQLALSVQSLLYGSMPKATVDNLKSAAKNIVPKLREMNCLAYRDPYGLRDVAVAINNKEHSAHSAIIEAIKRNDSVASMKSLIPPKDKGPDDKKTRLPAGETKQTEVKRDEVSPIEMIRRAVDMIADNIGKVPLEGNISVTGVFAARLKGYQVRIDKKAKQ